MGDLERREAINYFVERWEAAEGNEDSESRSFWIEFVEDVIGTPKATHHLNFERRVQGRKIDVFYEDKEILIEQKSRGVDLDKKEFRTKRVKEGETPYEQARWYYNELPRSQKPRWIIVSNFDEFRIHDMETSDPGLHYVTVTLRELPKQAHLFRFFKDDAHGRIRREQEVSVEAGRRVARLYGMLAGQYDDLEHDPALQESLNILIVRLVFLLYAEDAGLLQSHGAFRDYLHDIPVSQMRSALLSLFDVLATPEDQRRNLEPELDAFPCINGGLFDRRSIVVPPFSTEIKLDLVAHISEDFDWSEVSPTIFGAVFESTLNPETRRSGGMHYTSVENIHKVIDPLFLDDLKAELAQIEGVRSQRDRTFKLRAFQEKLGTITVLDPACGSGNFLTESYLELRRLENRVLEDLRGADQTPMLGSEFTPICVTLDQFYGIEINDFAVAVAKTALWIAEAQMKDATQFIIQQEIPALPLTSNTNIVEANALRIDWNSVVPARTCDYICGNPPFVGYSNHDAGQQEDRELLFGKNCKVLDYVACWYKKASRYIEGYPIRCAFVSTNSICQGQQVEPLWKPLFDDGICIDFAHQAFVWNSEATDQAHVHVIVVGFSRGGTARHLLFGPDGVREVDHINAYLAAAPDAFITRRAKPLCDVPEMTAGGKPTDGGNLILSPEERDELLSKEPDAARWIRPFSMGAEFINGIDRSCLWLVDAQPADWQSLPLVRQRVERVREFRLQSPKAATREKAETPWLFDEVRPPKGHSYLAIPKVSSERRRYIPIGFVTNGMVPGDMLFYVSDAGLYDFGIITSQFHNAWMRVVTGRLKSDYRYSNTIVYNNFIWPDPTDEHRQAIENAAQAVLDARENHPGKSLADLYDPDKMPYDLKQAHHALDRAIEAAYGVGFEGDEEKIVAHLFKLYARATGSSGTR